MSATRRSVISILSSLRRNEMFIDSGQLHNVFAPLGTKCKKEPNIALLTEWPIPYRLVGYKHVTPTEWRLPNLIPPH